MGHTHARTPARRRRRALLGIGAAVAFALAVQATRVTTTSAETPSRSGHEARASTTGGATTTPRVLASSFLGGQEWDEGSDVEVDRAGNSVVAGFTLSSGFPVAAAEQARFAGLADAFVTKVSADGRRVLWSTFLGGVDVDLPNSLAMDLDGNVYVTGRTASPDFPTTDDAFQPALRGELCQREEPCHDAFITKISPEGRVVYSTLFGGSANEEGVSIAVDRRGRAWVAGITDSADLPVEQPLQEMFQSPPCPGHLCEYDVFVAALQPDGSRLHFSTYLGGNAGETAGGIAVDEAGSAYVTGTTRSDDFPVAGSALQRSITGLACGPPPGAPCLDVFVSKIMDRRLAFSTYFGGVEDERSGGIAVDRTGQAVITGSTRSPDLPLRSAGQRNLDNASCTTEGPEERCDDAFVTQLAADGESLVYSTYLGGRAEDQGLAVTVDTEGNAHVAGRTDSTDFPVRRAVQPQFGGYIDGFASTLAARTGQLVRSTFVGGAEADRATGVDAHRSGSLHLTGRTLSPDFPTMRPFQPALAEDDDYDAFLRVLR